MIGIDPLVDYAFKRLFADPENKSLLIRLLNAVLRIPEVVDVAILNPFNEFGSMGVLLHSGSTPLG